MKVWLLVALSAAFLLPIPAQAFDVVNEKLSYVDNKFITLRTDLGFTGFLNAKGVDADTGFGFRVGVGHHFNEYMETEFIYQFSTFDLISPDPVNTALRLKGRAAMNQEVIRLNFTYPALLLQPYATVGFGGYDLFDVNSDTALSFSTNMQVPIGAGIRAYTYKNNISFNLEFNYQLLWGQNQSADTLKLLGLKNVSFNSYSFMAGFLFHFF